MRVLVTGGAGFIGSNLAKGLRQRGDEVVVFDDFSSGHWSNLVAFDGELISGDLTEDDGRLEEAGPFDAIFHQASITDTTVTDQALMVHNNVQGFRVVLEMAQAWNSRVIWAGSASVYGRGPAPMTETASPDPLNVYAYSKLAMERLARQYRLEQPIIGLRYFNVYGPGEDHKGKFASMIHQLAKQMRAGGRPRIFRSGEQKRDFVHVEDVVQANLHAAAAEAGGIFNVGSGSAQSFNRVVEELNRALKTDLQPDYFENPYGFTQDCTEADLTASQKALGYKPRYDLAKGIDAYLASGQLGICLS